MDPERLGIWPSRYPVWLPSLLTYRETELAHCVLMTDGKCLDCVMMFPQGVFQQSQPFPNFYSNKLYWIGKFWDLIPPAPPPPPHTHIHTNTHTHTHPSTRSASNQFSLSYPNLLILVWWVKTLHSPRSCSRSFLNTHWTHNRLQLCLRSTNC